MDILNSPVSETNTSITRQTAGWTLVAGQLPKMKWTHVYKYQSDGGECTRDSQTEQDTDKTIVK